VFKKGKIMNKGFYRINFILLDMGFFNGIKKSIQDKKDQERLKQGKYVPSRDPVEIEKRQKGLDLLSLGDLSVVNVLPQEKVPIILLCRNHFLK
jgi:hypothetical protein